MGEKFTGGKQIFEELLDESTDAARRLDTDWIYEKDGQVFGPVPPRELLEMLYRGEIGEETPVSCEDSPFQPLRDFDVFRPHFKKARTHQAAVAEAEELERLQNRRRLNRRAGFLALSLTIAAAASLGVVSYVRHRRSEAVRIEKEARERALREAMDELLARVTIEPPLLELFEKRKKGDRRSSRRRRRRGFARISKAKGSSQLTQREVIDGVGKVFRSFKRCIVAQIRREADSVEDRIVLIFTIGNDGAARDVSLQDPYLRKSPLRGCLAAQLSRVRWRSYRGEVRNVEYPITIGRR